MDSKEIVVNNLGEFINEINNIASENFYYRGESKKYINISAGTFRNMNGKNNWNSHYFKYKEMLRDYYKQVAGELTKLERENFMPYAQHYGLPTPLIDITNNPLTALYFSLDLNSEDQEDIGYVYLFSKNKNIDVSNLLINNWDRDILKEFINQDIEVWNFLLLEIYSMRKSSPDYFYSLFVNLIYWCSNYENEYTLLSSIDGVRYLDNKIINYTQNEDIFISDKEYNLYEENKYSEKEITEKIQNYISKLYEDKDIREEIEKIESQMKYGVKSISLEAMEVIGYLLGLKSYLSILKNETQAFDVHHLPMFPNLIVHPTILFDRMLVQDGLFVYQLSMYQTEDAYKTQTYLIQDIIPDKTIKIKNKKNILKQLNSIGINQSKLFPDPENIAKYMKKQQKYFLR